jgi:hypothetical protein
MALPPPAAAWGWRMSASLAARCVRYDYYIPLDPDI